MKRLSGFWGLIFAYWTSERWREAWVLTGIVLAMHYGERQKLEQQNARLAAQMNELEGRLGDSQRHNDELQRKIDALADIERSLPKPPASGNGAGGAR